MKLDKFPFASDSLGNSRLIRVLYPDDLRKRYPVLYVHDGMCAFRKDTPLSWESFDIDGALKRTHHEMIVVSLEAQNAPIRTAEYSPFSWINEARKYLAEGQEKGELYLSWLFSEVKPYIDAHYKTLKDREHTYMYGTSLGAVISVYAAARYPGLLKKVGCGSLASWGNEPAFLAYLRQASLPSDLGFFIRVGTSEGIPRDLTSLGECYPRLSGDLRGLLLEKGLKDVDFAINPNRKHCTKDWALDMDAFITWLTDGSC